MELQKIRFQKQVELKKRPGNLWTVEAFPKSKAVLRGNFVVIDFGDGSVPIGYPLTVVECTQATPEAWEELYPTE